MDNGINLKKISVRDSYMYPKFKMQYLKKVNVTYIGKYESSLELISGTSQQRFQVLFSIRRLKKWLPKREYRFGGLCIVSTYFFQWS